MAQFTAIDDTRRIWSVENLLDQYQVQEILNLDWISLPWRKAEPDWVRRIVDPELPEIKRLSNFISSRLPEINNGLGTNFSHCGGAWWVDEPGFTISVHTDGHLPYTMQLSWLAPDENYGTGFYWSRGLKYLRHQFKSIPNTGYVMINDLNVDGSQPLLWHGMLNPVPLGFIRVSSYWYFYK